MNIYKCADVYARMRIAEVGDAAGGPGLSRTADHYGRRLAQIDLTNLALVRERARER